MSRSFFASCTLIFPLESLISPSFSKFFSSRLTTSLAVPSSIAIFFMRIEYDVFIVIQIRRKAFVDPLERNVLQHLEHIDQPFCVLLEYEALQRLGNTEHFHKYMTGNGE